MSSSVSLEYLRSLYGNGNTGFTSDGGLFVTLLNNTGETSQKGTIVTASTVLNTGASIAPADSTMPLGIVYDNGIAINSPMKVIISGLALVLLKDGNTGTRGYWCGVSDVAGRMYQSQTVPINQDEHNRQIGYCLQSASSGTNVFCLVNLVFN